LHRVYGVSR